MATNPLYNTNDSPNNATQPSKAVNDMQVFVNRNRNTFDLSYFNFKTQRFGQYEPFFVMEGVPGDTIPLHSSHQVRSLPMKSPFLSSLTLSKDYFMVPMQAILPNTWEMIFSNPASGDDVPNNANCVWTPFEVVSLLNSTYFGQSFVKETDHIIATIKLCFILESLFSSSSLPSQLGFPLLDNSRESLYQFDSIFNDFLTSIIYPNVTFKFSLPSGESVTIDKNLPIGVYCDFLRFNASYLTQASGNLAAVDVQALTSFFSDNEAFLQEYMTFPVNMSRILAYQLSCQQFYVNTKIDPIFNSQIYRDNYFYLLSQLWHNWKGVSMSYEKFTRNGIGVPYDFFSGYYYETVVSGAIQNMLSDSILFTKLIGSLYDIFEYVFSFRRVLKFGDYFSSCRTQPLGSDVSGQMNAPVVGDKVAAIDMSKSIVMQRFLNNVVKLGNDFGEYLRGIFGTEPSPDYHFPKFISHQEFDISGFEVANSNDVEQGKLVTNLNSGSDKYAFEVRIDMPCILLGISSFNCPRVYGNARSRFFYHKDRFDMFNPMLQYIGDQIVYRDELNPSGNPGLTFGYQSRNAEYKQSYSVASGGFLYDLPSWTFVADFGPDYSVIPKFNQTSDFIRVYPFEFDRFFPTLSGSSLADAFHFIVVYNNKVMASRPMAVNPSIL